MKKQKVIAKDISYIGSSDYRLHKFENLFPIPNGVSYNSYFIDDEQTAVIDTVDSSVGEEFLENIENALQGRKLNFVIVNHLEPDHSATLMRLLEKHTEATVVMNHRAVQIFKNFFDVCIDDRLKIVNDEEELTLGTHTLKFIFAPMVHWPEVMMTYDKSVGVLFSADAFGAFGAVGGSVLDNEIEFACYSQEMRRYYANIVGKFGSQVVGVLKRVAKLEINAICPLHGVILTTHIAEAVDLYLKWANYSPESDGVLVVYASMYGNTKKVAFDIAEEISSRGRQTVVVDVSSLDISYIISEAFKYKNIVLACVTYNGGIFPKMENLILDMKALNLQNRNFAFVQNGSWSPTAAKQMKAVVDTMKNCKQSTQILTIKSATILCEECDVKQFVEALLEL